MKLPEYVYLITVEGEQPVTAVAGDIDQVATAVKRRTGNARGFSSEVRVWRVPVSDPVEMKMTPASAVPACEPASEEDKIRDAMTEARDHPGRIVTR
jgi:hypothetical protein